MEGSLNSTTLIYNIVFERYQEEWQRKNQIENKATSIIGFVGIIFGLLSNTGVYLLQQRVSGDISYSYSLILFISSLIFFIITMVLCISALYLLEWYRIPDTEYLLKKYVDKQVAIEEILGALYWTFSEGVAANIKKNDNKTRFLKCSFFSFGMGIFLTALFVFSLVMKI